MRTTKRNVIDLDVNETVEIKFGSGAIVLRAIDGDYGHRSNYLEATIAHGKMISNMTHHELLEVGFTQLEEGIQELSGEIQFIIF